MIKHAATESERKLCQLVRMKVFVKEQGIDPGREIDEFEAGAEHFYLMDNEEPVATVRYRKYADHTVKVERMAVLPSHRDKGIGRQLLSAAESHAQASGYRTIILNAQSHAVSFYEKQGYKVQSEAFMEENISHFRMVKQLCE